MSDWQIGDLAACISTESLCGECVECGEIAVGQVVTVIEVSCDGGLEFAEATIEPDSEWCPCAFRKIRPDEQEACEPEFITLLKRSKVPETASDWLIRVGQLAKQLNEESLGDCPSGTVATQASPRAGSRLGHSVSVNYRKDQSNVD